MHYLLLASCVLAAFGGEDSAERPADHPVNAPAVTVRVLQSQLKSEETKLPVKLKLERRLIVELESKATGFVWSLTKYDKETLILRGKPTIRRGENKPGASEFKIYEFEVKGNGSVAFELARPFGENHQAKRLLLVGKISKPEKPESDHGETHTENSAK